MKTMILKARLQLARAAHAIGAIVAQTFQRPLALANSTTNTTGYLTRQATGADIPIGRRVRVGSDGLIAAAGAAEGAIGVTIEAIAANGFGTVKLFNAGGTFTIRASAAITRGAQLFPAAAGSVAGAGTTAIPLVALEAAGAAGDLIECGPLFVGA